MGVVLTFTFALYDSCRFSGFIRMLDATSDRIYGRKYNSTPDGSGFSESWLLCCCWQLARLFPSFSFSIALFATFFLLDFSSCLLFFFFFSCYVLDTLDTRALGKFLLFGYGYGYGYGYIYIYICMLFGSHTKQQRYNNVNNIWSKDSSAWV